MLCHIKTCSHTIMRHTVNPQMYNKNLMLTNIMNHIKLKLSLIKAVCALYDGGNQQTCSPHPFHGEV